MVIVVAVVVVVTLGWREVGTITLNLTFTWTSPRFGGGVGLYGGVGLVSALRLGLGRIMCIFWLIQEKLGEFCSVTSLQLGTFTPRLYSTMVSHVMLCH